MDLDQGKRTLLASLLGLTSCTIFYSMNTTLNYINLPVMYMGSPVSSATAKGRFIIDSDNKAVSTVPNLLRQWQEIYWRGHRIGPPSATFSGATLFYAAYHSPSFSLKQKLYVAAGCWAMAAWPFTVFAMIPTNDELHRLGDLATESLKKGGKGNEGINEEKTFKLLKKWEVLSKVRAMLAMVAAGCVVGAMMI